MINKGAFSQEEMSACPIALTTSSPSSPVNDGSRNASSTFNPRTAPNCARCKNHGLKVQLKGHKRYCRYWNCVCDKCVQTSTRQKVMARETAHRRARKLHETKIMEYRKAQERARLMGERSPEPPIELLNPILSPDDEAKSTTDVDDDRSTSPNSVAGSGTYPPSALRKTALTPPPPAIAEDPSTSDKVDLRSSLRSLQELLLQENFPLEISSLLYLILKDTPEPKKAFNRIVEAQSELNAAGAGYSKEETAKSHVENWPLYIGPYLTRPGIFTTPPFSLTHPAFSLSPPYYQPYSTAGAPLSFPAPCRYPYLGTISALKSSDSLFYSPPLTYPEEKKHRLSFEPIQITKEDRTLTRPSNLCIRESAPTSGYSTHLDSKFPATASASAAAAAAAVAAAASAAVSETK